MKQDEAEKLAREIKDGLHPSQLHSDTAKLCDHVLSGDLRREIENAAYQRAIDKVKNLSPRGAGKIQQAIRSLIQPPAQKGGGE